MILDKFKYFDYILDLLGFIKYPKELKYDVINIYRNNINFNFDSKDKNNILLGFYYSLNTAFIEYNGYYNLEYDKIKCRFNNEWDMYKYFDTFELKFNDIFYINDKCQLNEKLFISTRYIQKNDNYIITVSEDKILFYQNGIKINLILKDNLIYLYNFKLNMKFIIENEDKLYEILSYSFPYLKNIIRDNKLLKLLK